MWVSLGFSFNFWVLRFGASSDLERSEDLFSAVFYDIKVSSFWGGFVCSSIDRFSLQDGSFLGWFSWHL